MCIFNLKYTVKILVNKFHVAGVLQTTNTRDTRLAAKAEVVRKSPAEKHAGSNPAARTILTTITYQEL